MSTLEAKRRANRAYYVHHREKRLAWARQNYKNNTEKLRARALAWKEANPLKTLILNCVQSARKRGHVCTLTVEQLEPLVVPMRCSMTGIELTWAGGPWMVSLDRLRNDEGYTIDNVRVVCWAFNSMRGEWADETVLTVARGLVATVSPCGDELQKESLGSIPA